jgi:hypothetical protein
MIATPGPSLVRYRSAPPDHPRPPRRPRRAAAGRSAPCFTLASARHYPSWLPAGGFDYPPAAAGLNSARLTAVPARRMTGPAGNLPPPAASLNGAGMTTVHHRYATVNGQRLFYREAGPAGAPAVLLLHGFPVAWPHRGLVHSPDEGSARSYRSVRLPHDGVCAEGQQDRAHRLT